MTILVTGGAGYIGSHAVVKLLEANEDVVVIDNLCNSNPGVFDRIQSITNKSAKFIQGDVRDSEFLKEIFSNFDIGAVLHFAGLKSVQESTENPDIYFDNNVKGSEILLNEMSLAGVKSIVFSSSATVYGNPVFLPYTEQHPLNPINTYGETKLLVEKALNILANQDKTWHVMILRYFNPVGAHPSGLIGENPKGTPNNLMPFVSQVAAGKLPYVSIFGNDYETPDGTGVRDYIHIEDLANGHLAALNYIKENTGSHTLNLGTGKGTSVLELIKAFEKACHKKINIQFKNRRQGDLASYWADVRKAKETLNWSAQLDINDMCEDMWRWEVSDQSK